MKPHITTSLDAGRESRLIFIPEYVLNNESLQESMIQERVSFDRSQAIRDLAYIYLVGGFDAEIDGRIVKMTADEIVMTEENRKRGDYPLILCGGWSESCEGVEALKEELEARGIPVELNQAQKPERLPFLANIKSAYDCACMPLMTMQNGGRLDLYTSTESGHPITLLCAFEYYDSYHFDSGNALINPDSFYDSILGQAAFAHAILHDVTNKQELFSWLLPKIRNLPE